MRDLLNQFDDARQLSDDDPVKRAQIQMRASLTKRFYDKVDVDQGDAGFAVTLDGKTARTPARHPMLLPSHGAADLVAREFSAQDSVIDPVTMPVMRLVNTTIDGVVAEFESVLSDLLQFAGSDLLCYRAGEPKGLVLIQNQAWNPVLEWARQTFGVRFALAEGVMHVEQPRSAIEAVERRLRADMSPFRLAALHLITTLTGSAVLALALDAQALSPDDAWTAAHVDEDWQIAHWGEDEEASMRRAARRRDFDAAVALIDAIRDTSTGR